MTPKGTMGLPAPEGSRGESNQAYYKVASPKDELVFHTFLPTSYTPRREGRPSDSGAGVPLSVNEQFLPKIVPILAKVLPSGCRTLKSFGLWEELQPNLDPGPMLEAVEGLNVGETLPVYLHEQNCVFLITLTDEEILTLSTFRLSLPASKVTASAGPFAMTYPTYSFSIPRCRGKVLVSKAFFRQVRDLDQVDMRESAATVRKANSTVQEKRDVNDPLYIQKWLLPIILAGDGQEEVSNHLLPTLHKKMRDSVRFLHGHVVRRSPLWTAIKATLHLLLVNEYGREWGGALYKIMMANIHLHLLNEVDVKSFFWDMRVTRAEMLRKVGRRIWKLEEGMKALVQGGGDVGDSKQWISDAYKDTLSNAARVTKTQHKALKEDLDKLDNELMQKAKFDLSDIKLWIRQTLFRKQYFRDLMGDSLAKRFQKVTNLNAPDLELPKRHRSTEKRFDLGVLASTEDIQIPRDNITIYDFERNVAIWETLRFDALNPVDASFIWTNTLTYRRLGIELYANDQVGYSRFNLTLLRIVFAWDKAVVEACPLLKEHRSGVDPNIFQNLLITEKRDLTSIYRMEQYFHLRNSNARYPSLIEEDYPTIGSFANRYVNSANGVQFRTVKSHIMNFSEEMRKKHLEAVYEARKQYEKIEAQMRGLECEYIIDNWKRQHDPSCPKCRLSREGRRMTVNIYEDPLPAGDEKQNAVVFELLIPEHIGVLRDLLHILHQEVIGNSEPQILHGSWDKYSALRSLVKRNQPFVVSLYSETKTFRETHYRDLHPTNPDSDFIKVNGRNCIYASKDHEIVNATGRSSLPMKILQSRTTMKVQRKSRYSTLQAGINGDYSQNDAIARQCDCHPDLSLQEYVDFLSLRSIKSLQFRGLFRCLSSQSLTLKEESVHNLICQVMWSIEGQSRVQSLRSNQEDFSRKEFCEEFLRLLEHVRTMHAENWKDHFVYLTLIYLAQLIGNLNISVEREVYEFLQRCKMDAIQWCGKIREILKSLTASPREEIDELRVKLVEVNCCIALCFKVSEIFQWEMIGDGSFSDWLLAVAQIHDNLVLLGDYKLKATLINLLRRVDELGVQLETHIQETIRCSDLLESFVEKHHSGAMEWKLRDRPTPFRWVSFDDGDGPSCGQIYYCDIASVAGTPGLMSKLQIDIIKGKFLVDGCPVGYLPVEIEKHPDFLRVFGAKSFEVQPYAFQVGRMITKDSFLGSSYSFFLLDNELTIVQHKDAVDHKLELISDVKFIDDLPFLLVQKYTHWFDRKNGRFEFYEKEKKLTQETPNYILSYESSFLYNFKNEQDVIVDVNCPDYQKILKVVQRLEKKKHMIVWCHMPPVGAANLSYKYTIDLQRMGLQFSVRNAGHEGRVFSSRFNNQGIRKSGGRRRLGDLISKEYRGMRVSSNQQSLGTLIGLQKGLLLEDADVNCPSHLNKVLLVPHGEPCVSETDSSIVTINNHEIRSPPFFSYEVDDRLKQLKAGDSRAGWLYLALLHALTTHQVADPFTGVTGMERAMQILQSGQCFSSEPLDDESMRTMHMIAELCPVRVYYPPSVANMEESKYYDPIRCCSEGYYLIIKKLIQDSLRLAFLFPTYQTYPTIDADENVREREEDLLWKNYWNQHVYLPELARLSGPFLDLSEQPRTQSFVEDFNVEDKFLTTVGLSQDVRNFSSSLSPKTDVKAMLRSLLLNGKDVKGVIQADQEGFPIKEGVYVWSRLDFRDSFLDLYNLARKVRRKDLIPEWTFLMCYLSFRSDTGPSITNPTVEQLNFLQYVMTYQDVFQHLDPPFHDMYTNTKETAFSLDSVKEILSRCRKPWESFMDRNQAKMEPWEGQLDFVARMKPEFEVLLEMQVDLIASKLVEKWPIDNADWIVKIDAADRSEINVESAIAELNLKLRSWIRNGELDEFIGKIGGVFLPNKNVPAEDNSKNARPDAWKKLFKNRCRNQLQRFCSSPRIAIDFQLLSHQFRIKNQDSLRLAQLLFHVDPEKFKEKALRFSDDDCQVPDFPLALSDQDKDPILKEYMFDLQQSWTIHHKQENKRRRVAIASIDSEDVVLAPAPIENTRVEIYNELTRNKRGCAELWESIKDIFLPRGNNAVPLVHQVLVSSEQFPRITPLTMLKLLEDTKPSTPFLTDLRDLVGGYGVALTKEQRSSRCVRYAKNLSQKNPRVELELQQELDNNGHQNWNPSDRPEWLLFEIEGDLMIRPIQAKVAKAMESPRNDENALIQLNMGEGKTWVIVPLLALSLADGKQLCRITVLKSLFQINKTYLSFRIGSVLLGRRLYCFPCRRDFKIGVPQAKSMLDVYKECVAFKGVVLTLPEHRLSFELKSYERFHCQKFLEGLQLMEMQNWLRKNARDVLDESDEILHVRYQLIYTLGKQFALGGGTMRWAVIQDLLTVLPEELLSVQKEFGPGFVEIVERQNNAGFPFCRILKTECAAALIKKLAIRVMNRRTPLHLPPLRDDLYFPVLDFLTNEQIGRDGLNIVMKEFPQEDLQQVFLILRGYLACGILVNCLTKRWRVNYGVAHGANYRRMAVPFRAKDVASERIEFGHPDVAILLTQLSYYYSGLSQTQVEHCFVMLSLEPNPQQEYARWVDLMPTTSDKDKIKNLSSVNLNDFFQRTQVVFPLLQFNRSIINFYLSRSVFPQESKQFGWKIGCSPWDLCNTMTTGFSGTNDSKILLPSTIKQRDLPELKGTNGRVLAALLVQKDNYEDLGEKVTAKSILEKMVSGNIRVLLDVGALMLELDNQQVCRTWLKLLGDSQISVDAAVYFDTNDKLVVLERSGNITPFELSTFRGRLDRTVIYLDDAHTRGTDLKIPSGNIAVVTLGKGVGKDKLVQGCMRMRKLAQGHSVLFWASREVHESIRSFWPEPEPITGEQVLLWAIRNNQSQISDGFVHWASAGVYVAQKLSALRIYQNSSQIHADLALLAENCSQKEQIELKAMYGDTRSIVPFPEIVKHLLQRVNRELSKLLARKSGLNMDCKEIVDSYGQRVLDHAQKYVPNVMRSTQLLDEEQERELEHELEAQCHKELPLAAKPWQHSTSPAVQEFIQTGSLVEVEKWAVKLPLALQHTSVWKEFSDDRWGRHLYCTKDFVNVVVVHSRMMDNYLRPVEWVAVCEFPDLGKTVTMLMSNYEVATFLHLFRKGNVQASLHMYNALTFEDQEELHRNPRITLPFGKKVGWNNWIEPPLTLFSGGSYFTSKEQEDAYAWYLGYLNSKVKDPKALVNAGGIIGGWIKPAFWKEDNVSEMFEKCPEPLAKAILRCRWGLKKVGPDSGVGRVFSGGGGSL